MILIHKKRNNSIFYVTFIHKKEIFFEITLIHKKKKKSLCDFYLLKTEIFKSIAKNNIFQGSTYLSKQAIFLSDSHLLK